MINPAVSTRLHKCKHGERLGLISGFINCWLLGEVKHEINTPSGDTVPHILLNQLKLQPNPWSQTWLWCQLSPFSIIWMWVSLNKFKKPSQRNRILSKGASSGTFQFIRASLVLFLQWKTMRHRNTKLCNYDAKQSEEERRRKVRSKKSVSPLLTGTLATV